MATIRAYMTTCAARHEVRDETLGRLAATDWPDQVTVVFDESTSTDPEDRQQETARRLLETALADGVDLILYIEDDVGFNRYLRANLDAWGPMARWRPGDHLYASLYNPGIRVKFERPDDDCFVADPIRVSCSQGLVISATTARWLLDRWELAPGMADCRMPRLAANVTHILYHRPSLVQHLGFTSIVGCDFHQAVDFSPDWRHPGHG